VCPRPLRGHTSETGESAISNTGDIISRQIAFFSRATFDGATVQTVLSQARIVLVGDGAVAEHTATGVNAAGMLSVRFDASDFSADAAAGAACVLVSLDSPAPAVLKTVNSASLKGGWPWIPGRIELGVGMIGPAVIPGQSACYRCFELRRQANLASHPAPEGDAAAAPGPLAACVGSLLAMEAVRLVSGFAQPQSMGRIMLLDFFAPEISSRRILRLPNCPDCGYGDRRLPAISVAGA
jgi:bacteriocin biosynthesis cyclodehydratase domain-containing protein